MSPGLSPESLRPTEEARLAMARLSPTPEMPLAVVLRRICELSAEALDVERVGVWFLVSDRSALRCANVFERSCGKHSEGTTLLVADFPVYFAALERMTAVPASFVVTDPLTAELADAYFHPLGITSTLDAPFMLNEQIGGVVCHEHIGPSRTWTKEDCNFAASVANLVALKVKISELSEVREALNAREDRQHKALIRCAVGVSHDFRNLLAVILGTVGQLERTPGMPKGTAEHLEQIQTAAERAASLANELTQFARGHLRPAEVVAVAESIEELLPLLQAAAGSKHPIDFQLTPGSGKVFLDPTGLERIMVNLVLNAKEAMPGGGTIGVRVGPRMSNGEPTTVRIEVTDAGAGISLEVRERIFDPYVTTKRGESGSGLGLAVVKQVVERAGGSVSVESEAGRGSTFLVDLPRVTFESQPIRPASRTSN